MRFDVWSHFRKIENASPICAGVLPNLEGKKPRQIDVMVFEGNTSSNEILRNQEKFDLIGIEVKSNLSNVKSVLKELNLYLNSGGLTKLNLAVPSELEESALSLLEDIPDVGLIIVERGIIKTKKKAKKLEMKYDSILFEQGGYQANLGFRTEVSRRIIEIGWGRDAKEHKSTYRYLGKTIPADKQISSTKLEEKGEIDEKKQTKRLDEWTK